jgi:hypothetical protein
MKIILSIFILLIPFSLSGKEVCLSLGGCKIIWETGKCVGCIEVSEKVVDTFTPVVKVVSLTTTSKVSNTNTNPHYKTYYDPDYKPEIKVVDTPTLDNGGNVILHDNYQRGIPNFPRMNLLTSSIHNWKHQPKSKLVLVSPIGKKPFYVKRSDMGISRCVSGCRTSRCSTLGLLCEGKYWIHKER